MHIHSPDMRSFGCSHEPCRFDQNLSVSQRTARSITETRCGSIGTSSSSANSCQSNRVLHYDQFEALYVGLPGGYICMYWAIDQGPKWLRRIVKEELKVSLLGGKVFYGILTAQKICSDFLCCQTHVEYFATSVNFLYE